MKVLITGIDGFIASRLFRRMSEVHETYGTSRRGGGIPLDLLHPDVKLPKVDVVYLCAAMTRFIDCEADSRGFAINVDGQIAVAKMVQPAKVVYLSSEAVERALHTNYGSQKAFCEMGLRTVCDPVIARLSKVGPETVDGACEFLERLATADPGIYRWPVTNALRMAA